MTQTIFLEHETVRGIDKVWEEVSNFRVGQYRLVWNPEHQCDCGNVYFVITHGWRVTEEEIEGGEVVEKRVEISRVVCPFCIDYEKEERIIGEFDNINMAVTMYDRPRDLTEDERRPGRWRKKGPTDELAAILAAEKPKLKYISGDEFLAWQRMMEEDCRRVEEYQAALAAYERNERTRPFRGSVKRAKEKPKSFKGYE